ncbi:aldehyde dehydrogenase family protein [Actinomarinicola tropica]|uniref:Aldehyde dehydrogenase family protein n=1 Tax=Actinomarinicola tropica TaxID=2789776 RepID=A0A5Q2RPS0_9ACTN|nr:aldehyde dehydrogenase family protein [Actinomarinicola tropica]QGG96117.1 aldehyde dehydrogenase family protein [Actinomarinicola tropica]
MTETISVTSPYDGRQVGEVPRHGDDDIDRAVDRAAQLHRRGALPAHERAAVLDRAAAAIEGDPDRFARIICDEAAKPISTARTEVARAIDTFRFSAAAARTVAGELVPMDASSAGEGKLGLVMRVPRGVVVGISPFNFPLNLVAHKVAPAIAAGCPIILKPATATPLTALELARLLGECGLPEGWLQVLTVRGSDTNRLVEHPDVAMITFTGSPDVGWAIRERVPRKEVGLELGNNTPVIVEPGVDVDAVAAALAVAGNGFAGQSCISVQRIYAHAEVADRLTDALVREVDALVVGDPSDDATQVSALIDEGEAERVAGWVDEAAQAGATVCTGASRDGAVLRPTVLSGITPAMKVSAREVFGPVVGVATYTDLEEAMARANDTVYGLQAGIFTPDLDVALRAARTLDFGAVVVNEVPTFRTDQMPYGGVRDSGNTREGPAYAVEDMTERRLVVIDRPL